MEIRAITPADALDEFVQQRPWSPFLQSWTWGEFMHQLGRSVHRIGAFENGQLVGAATMIEHRLPMRRMYHYIPRGPLAISPVIERAMQDAVLEFSRKHGAMFLQIDPGSPILDGKETPDYKNWRRQLSLQPEDNIVIDLRPEENQILAAMHQKTRYNINLSERKPVQVRWSTDPADLEPFLACVHATSARQNIHSHPDGYYRTMFATLAPRGLAELVLGEIDGAYEAVHLIIWFGSVATYAHGGSLGTHRDAMVPYRLQWETIRRAKERGYLDYDLLGVAPNDNPQHRLAGVTRFKRGFQGRIISYPSAAIKVFQPAWYAAYRLASRVRRGLD